MNANVQLVAHDLVPIRYDTRHLKQSDTCFITGLVCVELIRHNARSSVAVLSLQQRDSPLDFHLMVIKGLSYVTNCMSASLFACLSFNISSCTSQTLMGCLRYDDNDVGSNRKQDSYFGFAAKLGRLSMLFWEELEGREFG
ncbi:hypothetical protein VNO77_12593 [Canavalia gladiata]|uniref:Uncharacterized protein n=1 Tax=Canavalia gladiata TaxID=3824 RepID=A0AAN9QR60_CANGL